ncbi:MAG: type II toxin-antitoxin system RelE/ParE family toxin [Microcella pacifica]|uniref:type II toxin-antitoxin system RelE/ParE family toxin n=1 Tax=Microcella pacifica TaxID=2591847 RepID=UPI003314A3EB
MTYRVRFTRNAQRDRDRILAWYDAEAPDESERFIEEFYDTARRLEDFPRSSRELRGSARRANLPVFPYQLWYRVFDETQEVEVVAVLHHRQDSAVFDGRLL